MGRLTGFGIGASAIAAALLATVPTPSVVAAEGKRVEVRRLGGGGYLGVSLEEVDKDDVVRLKLSDERGALVKEVRPDTPAAKAGLKEGDVVLRYQGETVFSVAQLTRLVRETPAGRTVAIEVNRNGAPEKITCTLGEHEGMGFFKAGDFDFDFDVPMPPMPPVPSMPRVPSMPAVPPLPPEISDLTFGDGKGRVVLRDILRDRGPRKLGISYQEISGQLAKYFRLAGDEGLLVTLVEEDGPAAKAGLKAGDVILKFDGKALRDSGDLRDAVAKAEPGQEVTLSVQRDGKPLDLKAKLAGETKKRLRRGETT